jgi:hypothetical protein
MLNWEPGAGLRREGKTVADLPLRQATKMELVISLKTS